MEVVAPEERREGGERPAVGEDGRPLRPLPRPSRVWCMQLVDRLWNHGPGTTPAELPFPAPKITELNSPPELERMDELRRAYPPPAGSPDAKVAAFVRPTPAHLEHCSPAMLLFARYMDLPMLFVVSDDRNVVAMQGFAAHLSGASADAAQVGELASGTLCTGWFMERRREESGGDEGAGSGGAEGGDVALDDHGGGVPTARQVLEATAMAESSGTVAQRQNVFILEDVIAVGGFCLETRGGRNTFAVRQKLMEEVIAPQLRALPNQRVQVETLPVVRVRHTLPGRAHRAEFNEDLEAVRRAVADMTDTQGAPFGGLTFTLPHSVVCSVDPERYATFRMPWVSRLTMIELLGGWILGNPMFNFSLANPGVRIRQPDSGLLSRLAKVPVEDPEGGTTYHFHIRVLSDPGTTPPGKERLELTPVWKTSGAVRCSDGKSAVEALALAISRSKHATMSAWSSVGPSLAPSIPDPPAADP